MNLTDNEILKFMKGSPIILDDICAIHSVKLGEIVDLGVELDLIKKSGSWFSYNDSKLAQGREAVKQLLKDNPELCEEIENKIREKLKTIND